MTADDAPTGPGPPSGRTLALGVALTLIVLTAAGIVAVTGGTDGPSGDDPPVVDDDRGSALADRVDPAERAPLPDARLEAFGAAGEIATSDYRGTPLVLNFWASWCPPCVEEMPDLQEVAEAADGRVAVLGVNIRDDRAEAADLVERVGVSYDLAVDPDGDLFVAVEAFGMPTTLFVDAAGEIRYRHTGPLDAEAIAALVSEHLGADIGLAR